MEKNHSGEILLFDDLSIMYGYNPEDPKRQILIISFLAIDISSCKGAKSNPQALITFLNSLKTS